MSRTKQLLSRPELPSLDEIVKDLESAPSDDVAFTLLQNYASGSGTELLKDMAASSRGPLDTGELAARVSPDTTKSYESAAKRPRQENSKSATSSKHRSDERLGQGKEESEIQECYRKVLRFLEMNSYLKDSQEKMTQQCSDLQELGQTVKDQINSLKTQLHSS